MSKKILLITGILVVVGIAAFFIFYSKPEESGENRVGFSLREFLPFGKSDNTDNGTDNTVSTEDKDEDVAPVITTTNQPVPRLRKISGEPVAGAVIFNTGTTSIVRFVEKGTGNVYEARSNTVQILRLTNTTIPKIIRASWLPGGSGFIAQTLIAESETVDTSFVKLNRNTSTSSTEILTPFSTTISKLPTGIKEFSIKPDGSRIFYYTTTGSGSSWFVSNPDGTGSSLVNSHPLTEWLPKWLSGNLVIMQNKGSYKSTGFLYSFDVVNKTLRKTGVEMVGISTNTAPDGSFSIFSNGGSSPDLFLVDNKKVTSTKLTAKSLAEKCAWLNKEKLSAYCAMPNQIPKANYPDDWYKGLVSFEDSIKKIDLANDVYYNTAYISEESDQKIDVIDISISPDDSHLIFRNKIDGYLWMLRIEE